MTWNLQNMAPPKKRRVFQVLNGIHWDQRHLCPRRDRQLHDETNDLTWENHPLTIFASSFKKNGGNKLTNIENLYNLSMLISNTLTYHSSTVIKCISTSSTLSASRPRYRLNHRSMLRWPRGQVIAYSCYILYYNIRIYIYIYYNIKCSIIH